VLRAGAYELSHRLDVPARVTIKEYVDVADAFYDKKGTHLVNAVLDQLARALRPEELEDRPGGPTPLPGEFELIARYFAPLAAGAPGALGLTDDVALIDLAAGDQLV